MAPCCWCLCLVGFSCYVIGCPYIIPPALLLDVHVMHWCLMFMPHTDVISTTHCPAQVLIYILLSELRHRGENENVSVLLQCCRCRSSAAVPSPRRRPSTASSSFRCRRRSRPISSRTCSSIRLTCAYTALCTAINTKSTASWNPRTLRRAVIGVAASASSSSRDGLAVVTACECQLMYSLRSTRARVFKLMKCMMWCEWLCLMYSMFVIFHVQTVLCVWWISGQTIDTKVICVLALPKSHVELTLWLCRLFSLKLISPHNLAMIDLKVNPYCACLDQTFWRRNTSFNCGKFDWRMAYYY